MVEAMANSVEDYLISALSFKLDPGASYVVERKKSSFYASGAQEYISGQGARVVRIVLNGDGWLDPSTVRMVYTLNNKDGTAENLLYPLCGPWSFFRRVRCLYQGAIVDDIDSYHRTHEMLHVLTSKQNRSNDDVEGFGYRWDDEDCYPKSGFITRGPSGLLGIAGGNSKTVTFKPLCGLFNQSKYIPLMWGGYYTGI
jgi:hypothetical protein